MPGSIEITTPAEDRGLLTLQELKDAAGSAAAGMTDQQLTAIGLRVADLISNWCKIASDGQLPATLVQETIAETFYTLPSAEDLTLARRFLAKDGVTVTAGGNTLAEGIDYTLHRWSGVMSRKSTGWCPGSWHWVGAPLVVTYQAGFASDKVPSDLKEVAIKMVQRRTGAARDPLLQMERIEIPGVRNLDRRYWVDTNEAGTMTPDMIDILREYETFSIG
jgi:hypothetical protein